MDVVVPIRKTYTTNPLHTCGDARISSFLCVLVILLGATFSIPDRASRTYRVQHSGSIFTLIARE